MPSTQSNQHSEDDITYGLHQSPFGWCVIAVTPGGICKIAFLNAKSARAAAVASIRETYPNARIARDDARVAPYVARIFAPKKSKRLIPLVFKGTNFQMKVWKALLAIPYGETVRYADIAKAIGSPKAVRAVGAACGKNPIGYLIPCHRVLASDGKLGGYRWGIDRKEAMLAREAARTEK